MTELPELRVCLRREQLVRYAGASGDFNPIHYSEHHAHALGLDSVVAHGMLTMGLAMRVVTAWCGDPARVVSCQFRFSRPVPVPDDAEGAEVVFTGSVAEGDEVDTVTVTASCGETTVGKGRAEVRRG
ncbi:dehydratase [Enemella dayhoffiae]|uniref:Dehydratase n=1 Tax=Enemella dayhoffiae TaxID=2016507 RepID=A0A255GSI2_9ACTN|nr:MaoC/PaaZ C-terminal domain-containing protein [Enemella dayhoffiae]OYO18402.1 dehydratase [Enemella dayhoffiae]